MGQIITDDVKKAITESPFVTLTTVSKAGEPHTIIVGKAKEIKDDDSVSFGIYKMVKTQENLNDSNYMEVVFAAGKLGFRLTGKACAKDGDIVFIAEKANTLL